MSYLPTTIYLLSTKVTYLSTYLPTYYLLVPTNLFIYLPILPTYLLMKKIEVQMLLYTLTKTFIEVQGKMLNAFGIILFYKVVGWFDSQNISVEPR